jgi:phosphoglycerate dehydrogenase-like enzyme
MAEEKEVTRSRIVAVGRPRSRRLVTNIVELLQRRGHEVRFYEDSAAFAGGDQADADVLLAVSSFACTRALMAPAENLRGVVSPTTGVEGFDIPAATERGILVANGQLPENVDGMAEATILLILASLYDLRGAEVILRQNLARPAQASARLLGGKTVGMIGFGQIARAVAARLAGWNVDIQVFARRIPADAPEHVRFVGLEALLRSSDVVCILAALNSEAWVS